MKIKNLLLTALVAFATLFGSHARADNMATIAITPATGQVTLVPRWAIGGGLAGFHHMAQDLSLGGGANQFYSIKSSAIPNGGDISAFTRYIAGAGAATDSADIGSKLTPNSYLSLTSADPDIGYGSVNFYLIHRKGTTDYFSVIKPSSGTASSVTDLKPMSGPGGPATVTGVSGYFGFTFAAANLGYGLNLFYYLRTDPVTGNTKFGSLEPALLGTSADRFDLGISGHNALAFTGTDVGYGTDKMYFLRLDPITGYTILGTLHPVTGRASDIANLGSVYSTLTFVPGDVGFGSGRFYTTGAVNAQWQSVSFAAIADRAISTGSFTVTPTASSGLPITLTVAPGSTGAASISGPVSGVFTITPTAPGVITLQAAQAGSPGSFAYNMLRQSFTASGVAALVITTQPTSQSAVTGTTATLSASASGTTALSYQWRKAGANITGNASATTATLSLSNVQAADAASYDVVVTNASGSIISNPVTLTVTGASPIITNSPLTSAGTVATPFSFTITASGTPTSYTASPLPAGLSIVAATGAITGAPTTVGTTAVLLGATNATGTGNATLTITVAPSGVAPIITNTVPVAAGTVGAPFSFTITASGTPTSYTAAPLPAGLTLNPTTGTITGTPVTAGTTVVVLGATNATGSTTATLTITTGLATVAPVITSPASAPGTVGAPFGTYLIAATGLPTSYAATGLPSGLTLNPLTGAINGTPTTAGTSVATLTATNSAGVSTAILTITVAPAAVAPIITSPANATAGVGTPFPTYVIAATGLPTSYTASGLPAGLTFNPLTGAINGTPTAPGTYNVAITASNSAGTSTVTLVIVVAPVPSSRIVSFSARAISGPGSQTLIMGFIVDGDGKNLLVRGVGPTLAAFGITAPLADPMLTLYRSNAVIASNDDWSTTTTGESQASVIASTSARVGAFTLPPGSKDSALLLTVNNGAHTTGLLRPNSTTGVALTEVYDTDTAPGAKLIGVAARMNVTVGEGTLIAGFVIAGNAPKTVLIRGVGPTLSGFGVAGVLADPQISVFSGASVVANNDNWETSPGTTAALVAATAQVGAFALPVGSKDAALLVTLQPGAYTVQVTGVGATAGVALIEVYEAL